MGGVEQGGGKARCAYPKDHSGSYWEKDRTQISRDVSQASEVIQG